MATMTIRTTVAFDPATVARWERLARRWGTSKSEALRRALEAAERQVGESRPSTEPDFRGMSPQEILDWIAVNPLLPAGTGEQWSAEIRSERDVAAARGEARDGGVPGDRPPQPPCP